MLTNCTSQLNAEVPARPDYLIYLDQVVNWSCYVGQLLYECSVKGPECHISKENDAGEPAG